MATRISSILPFFLITVVCVAAVELGYQAFEMLLEPPLSPVEDAGGVVVPAAGLSQPGSMKEIATDYKIIVERNLFGSSLDDGSKAEQPKIEEDPVLKKTELDLVLMGTVNGGEEEIRRAIVLNLKKGKQEILEIGDNIEGGLVKQIQRGQVVLTVNGTDEVMDMSDAAKHRTPASAIAGMEGAASSDPNLTAARRKAVGSMTAQRSRALVRKRNVKPRTVRPARRVTPRRSAPVNN